MATKMMKYRTYSYYPRLYEIRVLKIARVTAADFVTKLPIFLGENDGTTTLGRFRYS